MAIWTGWRRTFLWTLCAVFLLWWAAAVAATDHNFFTRVSSKLLGLLSLASHFCLPALHRIVKKLRHIGKACLDYRPYAFTDGWCSCRDHDTGRCGSQVISASSNRIQNVAFGKRAKMSSRFSDTQGRSGPACAAVNGRTGTRYRTLGQTDTNCVHSADNDDCAWWMVDLGQDYTVSNITIYTRHAYATRMANIDVYVNDTKCYTFPDDSHDIQLESLPDEIRFSCHPPLFGRRVSLEKQKGNRENSHYFINVCEVQVWVCARGYYGNSCQNSCGRCKNNVTCNTETGACPGGCQSGLKEPNCVEECDDGTYGDNCLSTCGNCSDACIKTNGRCPTLCQPGFDPSDPLCKTTCTNQTFGKKCSEKCSETCGGSGACDPVTGRCVQGCQAGFLAGDSDMCHHKCPGGTYGSHCASRCGHCSGNCNNVNGSCPAGCQPGFDPSDLLCRISCMEGTHGIGCRQACSQLCGGNGSCHFVTGRCLDGCVEGFVSGVDGTCAQELTSDTDTNVAAIAAAVVAVAVVAAVAVFGVCFFVRRRREKAGTQTTNTVTGNEAKNNTPFSPAADAVPLAPISLLAASNNHSSKKTESSTEAAHVYYNIANTATPNPSPPGSPSQGARAIVEMSSPRSAPAKDVNRDLYASEPDLFEDDSPSSHHVPIYGNTEDEEVYASFKATQPQLDTVQKYLVDKLASGQLNEDFATIPKHVKELEQKIGALPKNWKKNRYGAILPYDWNRVVLNDGYTQSGATDFVNASYVSGYHSTRQYIATQGPRINTVTDFWRMVWQERVLAIVMLTNLTEGDKKKCFLYWPEKEGSAESYGFVTVTLRQVECRDSFYVKTFAISKNEECRQVTQYHYVSWPDHGVPTTTSLVSFWRHVHANTTCPKDPSSAPPVVVHCSAGVGRTGTYIGLELGMEMAVHEGSVDVLGLVQRLRAERYSMVQAAEQYTCLHKALLEAYCARGTIIAVEDFNSVYTKPISSAKSMPRIDKEFQRLIQLLSLTPQNQHDSALLEENLAKNRDPNVLPSEAHMVLLTEPVSGHNQYINAVFMPTFRDAQGSIVTQLPLPSTLVDFWRLVYGNDVTTIVSLSSPHEDRQLKQYCQYWPADEGKTIQTGPYKITLMRKIHQTDSEIITYDLNVDKKKGASTARSVHLVLYRGWTGEVGGKTTDILHLIDTLVTCHSVSKDSRLLVQCSDGVGKSGLFCALCGIINQMTHDRQVDVFMTIRHIQSVSQKAISSVVQYRYCYEVAQRRVQEMSIYANN